MMRAWIAFALTLVLLAVNPLLAQDVVGGGGGEDEEEELCADRIDADGEEAYLVSKGDVTLEFTMAIPDLDAPFPFFMYEFIELDYVMHVAYYQTEGGSLVVLLCDADVEVGG